MIAHTPGPWFVPLVQKSSQGGSRGTSVWARGGDVRIADCTSTAICQQGKQADARLIAAAPELLEALIAMVECDKEAIADAERFGIPFPDELLTSYHQACAAITKATGETP